jgi:hypothetical protein
MLPVVQAIRYVTPLREGGSLPGIVEADDLGTYVVKFRGAGQGSRVLVAEVIVGELARRLGFRVPALVAIELSPDIARYEADQEVQDLLTASVGLNLGVDFLPGSFGWDPHLQVDGLEGARILWLDAFTANVDRTWRNPNVLSWHRHLWLIDHGASLYFHHAWSTATGDPERFARQPYDADEHIMAGHRPLLDAADAELRPAITRDLITDVVATVPDEWLVPGSAPGGVGPDVDEVRAAYTDHLLARAESVDAWLPRRSAA